MAAERNTSSVLAKLMGIDRLSSSKATRVTRRVLSENYLRNVALVSQNEKSLSDLDISVSTMDGDNHLYIDDMAEVSEGSCVDDIQFLPSANGVAGQNTRAGGSHMKNELEKLSFLSRESTFDLFGGYLSSSLGHLAVHGSSQASVGRYKSSKTQAQQPKACYSLGSRSYTHKCLREQREVINDYRKTPKRSMELPGQNEKSYVSGRAFSLLNHLSDIRKQKSSSHVRNKDVDFQQTRTKSLSNGVESVFEGSVSHMSSKRIAEQVTIQLKQSLWHSSIDAVRSGPRTGESRAREQEGTIMASSCLSDSENKRKALSSSPAKLSDLGESLKCNDKLLESCQARKFSQKPTFLAEKFHEQMLPRKIHFKNYVLGSDGKKSSASVNANVNYWEAGPARYLSKQALFPSAWVPKSKTRNFTLDRNWCFRPGNSKVVNKSLQDDISYVGASTFESKNPSQDFKKHNVNEKAPSISNNFLRLEDQHTPESVLASCESFSFKSAHSDLESPTYQEACITLNETMNNHLKEDVSQDCFLASLSPTCKSTPVADEVKEIIYEQLEKIDVSGELKLEQSSTESSTSIWLDDVAPNQQDFVSKHELKPCAPGSPVSSLEGPEACRRCLHFSVESKEIFSSRECLGKDYIGLQTKLHQIEAASLESGSEPGMMVSSDEGDEIGSVDRYREDTQITECTPENLNYSYLVDVLVESGILMENLGMDSQTWCSHSNVLKPFVFNALEKKYGKASVTDRSERRLLFDRINSGLQDILQPTVGINTWRKPVVKRLGARRTQVFIEEELWDLLMNQEQECKKESSDNVCRREMEWLNLGDEIDLIAHDIQSLMIDELIEEFVTMEMSFC